MTPPEAPTTDAIAAIPAVTLRDHIQLMVESARELQRETDRRYAEVNIEREKALKIKEQADRDALELARQDRNYKDEQANKLREQINSERGLYATKEDVESLAEKIDQLIKGVDDKASAAIVPLTTYVASQQGVRTGSIDSRAVLITVIGFIMTATAIGVSVIALVTR